MGGSLSKYKLESTYQLTETQHSDFVTVLEIPETRFSHRDESKVGLRLKSGANKHS